MQCVIYDQYGVDGFFWGGMLFDMDMDDFFFVMFGGGFDDFGGGMGGGFFDFSGGCGGG